MDGSPHIAELRELIARGDATLILGAGIAKAIAPAAPTWTEAIERAQLIAAQHAPADLGMEQPRSQTPVPVGPTRRMVALADQAAKGLGPRNGHLWREFLINTFGALRPSEWTTIDAIGSLGLRMATTNYDTLIERSLGLKSVTPTGLLANADRRRRAQEVIHLHGIFSDPESVVWTRKDYRRLSARRLGIYLQQSISANGLIFIGCGGTLDDPNLIAWRKFLTELSEHGIHAFRLYCDQEDQTESSGYRSICYGQNYSDLPTFLYKMATGSRRRKPLPPLTDFENVLRDYLVTIVPSKSDRFSRSTRNVKMNSFANKFGASLELYFLRYILNDRFADHQIGHESLFEAFLTFQDMFGSVGMTEFFSRSVKAFFDGVLIAVGTNYLSEEEFENAIFEKFFHGADGIDVDDLPDLRMQAFSERASTEFRKSFFDQWRGQFNFRDAEDQGAEYQGAVSCDEQWVRFHDVIDDGGFDSIFVRKSDLQKWRHYRFEGRPVGSDDILVPEYEFEEFARIHGYAVSDRIEECLEAVMKLVKIDGGPWEGHPLHV